ncbi:MAG: proline--tRNA ligase [Candidatus Dormibacteraeota bacterium]|nr:proline--tRNA ligase [Candidatus Dormibacteraeota bacterium]
MRVSQLFGATLRAAPSDELFSHQLLLRAGYLQQLAAGIFSLLPLGVRSQERIRRILREELDAIGGQEVSMPVVQPADLWQRSGRWQQVDETLVRFQDRRGREMVVAMTHEEVVADLAASQVTSYRDLPRIVYQIQTKFRDEPRPRAGLIRTREFWMKDSYSLDRDPEGLRAAYRKHFHAYFRIAARAGLPVAAVLSDVGMMGGKVAHEFMYLSDQGEDTLLLCPRCGYAANQEVAERLEPPPEDSPELPLQEVATPGCTTVAEVAAALQVELSRVAKTVGYVAEMERGEDGRVVLAVVPGDREVNLARLRQATGAVDLRVATAEELAEVGAVAGYMSPRGLDPAAVTVVADSSLRRRRNLVAGANREGWHLRNFNLVRDGQVDQEVALGAAVGGDPCPSCGGPLDLRRGIEYGNIFQLGTRYSEALGAVYTDEEGRQRPVVMGSYGIGLGRLLACVAEEHHDERGLTLPISIAPFQVALVQVGSDPEVVEAALGLYDDLERAGVETLYDDRDVSAGIKFADSDLRGMPLRVTVSPRTLQREAVELKRRLGEARDVPRAGAAGAVQGELGALWRELDLYVGERMAGVGELAARTFGPAG